MKKETIIINASLITIITLLMVIIIILLNQNKYNKYDVNKDGKVSAVDYVEVKNYIMNQNY